MPLPLTPLSPVGARVDAALTDLGPDEVDELRHLLAEHGVLLFAGQELDDAAFVAFLRRFGDLTFTQGETSPEGFPDLNVVSNVGRTRPPRSRFHVDTTYVRRPPAYTALRAVTVPAQGGETLFTNQYVAHDTLDPAVREHLAGRLVRHEVTGVELGPDDERSADHPVFPVHPVSGRPVLYLSTPERCTAISGLDADESARTIEALYAHATRDDNVLRHAWAPGDVVIWDNLCVLHRADHAAVEGDRVLHRGMVAGYGPVDGVAS